MTRQTHKTLVNFMFSYIMKCLLDVKASASDMKVKYERYCIRAYTESFHA